jgi:hypothetical protein
MQIFFGDLEPHNLARTHLGRSERLVVRREKHEGRREVLRLHCSETCAVIP